MRNSVLEELRVRRLADIQEEMSCRHKFAKYFSILNGVKRKITHSIAPVNIQSSICVTGVSYVCPNVCQIVLSRSNLFLESSVIANSAIAQPLIKFSGIIQCHTLEEINLIIIIYYNGGYDLLISRRTYCCQLLR